MPLAPKELTDALRSPSHGQTIGFLAICNNTQSSKYVFGRYVISYLDVKGAFINPGIDALKVRVGGNDTSFEDQYGFDNTCNSTGSFQMPNC